MKYLEEKYGVKHECILNLPYNIEDGTIWPLCTLMKDLLKEDKDLPIALIVNSTGGCITEAAILADFVRMNDVNLITLAIGHCESAATFILQLGRPRLAAQNAVINFHELATTGHVPLSRASEIDKAPKQSFEYFQKITAERTGKPLKVIKRDCRKAKIFTAQEAKEYGLIDEII